MTRRARIQEETVVEIFPKFTKTPAEWGTGGRCPGIGLGRASGMSHKYELCDINTAQERQNEADQGVYRGQNMSHKSLAEDLRAAERAAPLCLAISSGGGHAPRGENSEHFTKIQGTDTFLLRLAQKYAGDQRKGRRVA